MDSPGGSPGACRKPKRESSLEINVLGAFDPGPNQQPGSIPSKLPLFNSGEERKDRRIQRASFLNVESPSFFPAGSLDPRCQLCIFMGKTSPEAQRHKQQSMLLVPMDSPGITITRPLSVFGLEDAPGEAEGPLWFSWGGFALSLLAVQ